jgi:toxin-antitoxin system PIN domain toxin
MLLDANLLLYAVDRSSDHHEGAAEWLTGVLNGRRRVGLPWQSIGAFLRIVTHPRVTTNPLTGAAAWRFVAGWLDAGPVWIPPATERTAAVYAELAGAQAVTGNLVPDAMLAALAIEHGLTVMSSDTDFARFSGVTWTNPLAD